MNLVWTAPAIDDLRAIRAYIARDAALYADQFVERILTAVDGLQDFPARGRIVPEAAAPAIRELLYQNYRIIYSLEDRRIVVLAVIHGSRDLSRLHPRPWDVV